jgi:hypothetical protein
MAFEGLGAVSPIIMTFGAINSAIGSYYQTQATIQNYKFQSQMANINAQIDETNAQAMLLAGQRAEQNVRLRAARIKSAQRVSMAANGIDLQSATAQNVLNSTDQLSEADALTVQSNALKAAFGYRTQAVSDKNASNIYSAVSNSMSPLGNAAGSLLSSGGSVAESWYKYSQRSQAPSTP